MLKLILSLRNKNCYKELTLTFLNEINRNQKKSIEINKEAQTLKVNSTSDLVKSSEHVT